MIVLHVNGKEQNLDVEPGENQGHSPIFASDFIWIFLMFLENRGVSLICFILLSVLCGQNWKIKRGGVETQNPGV
jgi:hypothetical protein